MMAKCQKQKEKGNMTVHSHYKIENIFAVYIQRNAAVYIYKKDILL